jgi:hypothetical protein
MGGATASALFPRAKVQAIPVMLGATAMGFAKCSTHPTICRFVSRIGEFVEADQVDLACPARPQKIFLFFRIFRLPPGPNHFHIPAIPPHTEGALRNVTDAERGAVDAEAPMDDRR